MFQEDKGPHKEHWRETLETQSREQILHVNPQYRLKRRPLVQL